MTEAVRIDGKAFAERLRGRVAEVAASFEQKAGRKAGLAVVLVGDDPASASYIKGEQRACTRIGMDSEEHDLPATASQDEVVQLVQRLNAEDGVLVQLPLPKAMDANAVTGAIDPAKDVDGLQAYETRTGV